MNLTSGHPYHFETVNLGCGNDTVLYLYRPDGTTEIGSDDDNGFGMASLLGWTADATGTFYVKVVRYGGVRFGPGTEYELRVIDMSS